MSHSRWRWRREERNAREAGLCGIGRSRRGWVDLEENNSNSEVGRIGGDDEWTVLKEVLEPGVHSRLESGEGITETERHDGKLIVPESRTKSSLGLVLLGYTDLVISATKIDLREEMVAGEAVKQIIRTRHGIAVFDHVVVETAVVNTETKGVVLLVIEEDRGTPWGSTRFNESPDQAAPQVGARVPGFGNRKAIWGAILNVIVGFKLDVVLDIAHGRDNVVRDRWWEDITILAKEGTNARRQGREKGVKFLGSGGV
ncbi:hypothetical protein CBR_g12534 [Chara braunii]|uniref:Uncharacterized protein n=1 Tax=Chara braunii TaxID=69332 RepID=A0A388JSM3_CHABU|nr:hypothetical protein CBR_g12534 [Chara braunii]|eukprot:GBG60796.1 hypothetical protein CBR_g12534 [Chara braunii]